MGRPIKMPAIFKGYGLFLGLIAYVVTIVFSFEVLGLSRIKDITSTASVRENVLVGYGIVVGLNKTGDDLGDSPYTAVSIVSMLERLGIRVTKEAMKAKSMAAVIVTAKLPAFARNGSHVDVDVSTIGSASNLSGGTLLVTPLMGADGEVYAVAQGAVNISGYAIDSNNTSLTKGTPTTARIPNGAVVEKEINYNFNALKEVGIHLNNPDFTTAKRISSAINEVFLLPIAFPSDSASVKVAVPKQYTGKLVDFMTKLEQIEVEPDQGAKVILDQESGVIVMGDKVRIDPVAIAQGNLVVEVKQVQNVYEPGAFTQVTAATTTTNSDIKVDENNKSRIRILPQSANLRQLVYGLNSLGVGPRDLIIILQSIKAAGALQAELQVI